MPSTLLFNYFQANVFSKWPKCSCLQPLSLFGLFLIHHAILHRPTTLLSLVACFVPFSTTCLPSACCLPVHRLPTVLQLPVIHPPPHIHCPHHSHSHHPHVHHPSPSHPPPVACLSPRTYVILTCAPAILAHCLPDDQPSATSTSPWLANDELNNIAGGRRRQAYLFLFTAIKNNM
jgi:hypothetical protein